MHWAGEHAWGGGAGRERGGGGAAERGEVLTACSLACTQHRSRLLPACCAAGKDVIGLAQTGSGKTGAFSLPILQELIDKPQSHFALILSPTRELAIQIAEQVEALGSGVGVKCAVLVGGIDMMAQAIALGKRPHIIVGTPGRVVDHLSNTKVRHTDSEPLACMGTPHACMHAPDPLPSPIPIAGLQPQGPQAPRARRGRQAAGHGL